jgi:hypothetical protein
LKAVEKGAVGSKGVSKGRVMEVVEQTKVKYTRSGDKLRNPFEHQLKYQQQKTGL